MKSLTKFFLVLVLLIVVGFTGWFIWHSKRTTDQTLNATNKALHSQSTAKTNAQPAPETVKSGAAASTTVQQTTLSQLSDLQTAVTAHLKASNGCLDPDGQIINESGQTDDPTVYYVSGSAARVTVCQGNQLYTDLNGSWSYVATTQGSFKCSDLQKNKIPAALIQTTSTVKPMCVNTANRAVLYAD